jgi:dual-specificity kinase
MFGKVVEAINVQTHNRVMIKIICTIPKYCDASKIEILVLQRLREKDLTNVQLVRFHCGCVPSLTSRDFNF